MRARDRGRRRRNGAGRHQRTAQRAGKRRARDGAGRHRERSRTQPGPSGRRRSGMARRDRFGDPADRRRARPQRRRPRAVVSPRRAVSASTRRWPPRWRRGADGGPAVPATCSRRCRELRRFENRRVTITIDGKLGEHHVLLVAIANGAYYGGGMRIAPDAQPDDGLLDLCVVGNISRLTAIRQLPNLYRGAHVRHPAVSMHRAARAVLDRGRRRDAGPSRWRAVRRPAARGRSSSPRRCPWW